MRKASGLIGEGPTPREGGSFCFVLILPLTEGQRSLSLALKKGGRRKQKKRGRREWEVGLKGNRNVSLFGCPGGMDPYGLSVSMRAVQ